MNQIKVVSITVLTGTSSTDRLYFKTELPEGTWPFKNTAVLSMEVSGKGEDYVKDHFPGVEYEVIPINN